MLAQKQRKQHRRSKVGEKRDREWVREGENSRRAWANSEEQSRVVPNRQTGRGTRASARGRFCTASARQRRDKPANIALRFVSVGMLPERTRLTHQMLQETVGYKHVPSSQYSLNKLQNTYVNTLSPSRALPTPVSFPREPAAKSVPAAKLGGAAHTFQRLVFNRLGRSVQL